MTPHHRLLFLSVLAALLLPATAMASPATPEATPGPVLVLEAPRPGSLLSGEVPLVVTAVDAATAEVRLRRDDAVIWGPERLENPADEAGVRRWETVLDLTRVPNGPAQLEVRSPPEEEAATARVDPGDEGWTQQWVVLDTPPPTPQISVRTGSRAGTAEIAWEGVGITDLAAVRLERAGPDDAGFVATVPLDPADLIEAGSTLLADLAPGEHRLRMTVERPGGLGGVLSATSEVAVVSVAAPLGIPRLPGTGDTGAIPQLPAPRATDASAGNQGTAGAPRQEAQGRTRPPGGGERDTTRPERRERRQASSPSLQAITGEAGYPDEFEAAGEEQAVPPAVAAEPEGDESARFDRTRRRGVQSDEELAGPGAPVQEPETHQAVSLVALLLVLGMIGRWGRLRHR